MTSPPPAGKSVVEMVKELQENIDIIPNIYHEENFRKFIGEKMISWFPAIAEAYLELAKENERLRVQLSQHHV